MKKLTKSAKIILVSVISAVCVLAIVLGAIFATRGKNPNDPNNPNNPVEKPLTWAEKVDLLGKEINASNNTTNYDIVLGVPYDGYVDDEHVLSEIGKNYFITKLNGFGEIKTFYYYSLNSKGTFNVINLTSKKSDGGCGEDDSTNFSVKSYNEKYVVLECSGSEYDYVFSVIDISGNSPKIIYTYKTTEIENKDQSIYDSVKISSDNKTIFFSLRVYDRDSETSNEKFNITYYLVSLQKKQLFELDTYGYDDGTEIYYSFQNNSLAINFNGIVRIYVVTNKLYTHLVSAPEGYKYSTYYHLYDKQFLIEYYKQETKSTLSDNSVIDDDTGNMGNYKYQLLSLENSRNELLYSDYSLDEKVARLEIKKYSSFYSILEKKIDKEHKFSGENKITYYYKDGDLVATYDYKSKSGDIVRVDGNIFVTESGIYKVVSALETIEVCMFNENFHILSNYFYEYIPIYMDNLEDNELFFFNYNGEKILSINELINPITNMNLKLEEIDKFIINKDGIFIKINDSLFKINFEEKTLDVFYVNADYKLLNSIYYFGYNLYFENKEKLQLKTFNGNILLDGISDYKFIETMDSGLCLELLCDNKNNYSLILKNINYNDLDITDEENYVENFANIVSAYNTEAGATYYYKKSDGWYSMKKWEWKIGGIDSNYKIEKYSDVDSGVVTPSGFNFAGWSKGNKTDIDYNVGDTISATKNGQSVFVGPLYPVFKRQVTVKFLNGTTVKDFSYEDVTMQYYNYYSGNYNTNIFNRISGLFFEALKSQLDFINETNTPENDWEFLGLSEGTSYNSTYTNTPITLSQGEMLILSGYTYSNSSKTTFYAIYSKEITTTYKTDCYGSVGARNLKVYGNTSTSFGRPSLNSNGLASGDSISKIGYKFAGWNYGGTIYKSNDYNWCPYSNFSNTTKSFTFTASWNAAKINLQFIFCQSINNNLKVVSDGVVSSSSDTLKDLGVKAMENNSYFTYSNIKYNNNYYLGYTDRYNNGLPHYLNGSIISNQSITFSKNLSLSNIFANIPSELITYRTTCLKNGYKTITQEISGWAFGPTNADKFDYLYSFKDNNKKLLKYSSNSTDDSTLIEYIKMQLGESYDEVWHNSYRYSYTYMTIPFYAYFEPRPYYVYTEEENVNGASFNKGNEFYEYANDNSTSVTYNFKKNRTENFGVNTSGYNIGLGSELKLEISLTQPVTDIGRVYTIGRIELKNYPYKTSYGYATMTAIFYVNFSSGSATITSNLSGKSDTGFYHSSSSDTNIVKFIEDVTYDKIIITITNVGLASDEKGKDPTSSSVGSTGQQGFTIKAYAVAGYANADESSSFVDKISVSGENNGYNKINNNNNPYGFTVVRLYEEGDYRYFWINSRKYYIEKFKPVNGIVPTCKVLQSWTDVKIKNDSNSMVASNIKTPYNLIDSDINCYIVVNGNYAFIISQNDIVGGKYIIPNYGSSEFYAIEPKQEFLNQVDSQSKIVRTKYELQSYISNITLPGGSELKFEKPVKFNESKTEYNEIINSILKNDSLNKNNAFNKSPFNTSGDKTDFTNYGYFQYLGANYYIIDMQEYAGRTSYHLYLGLDKDTGKYMYFLVGQDVNEGKFNPTTSANTISITFTNIESTINIKADGINDDTYDQNNTNGLDISYGKSTGYNNVGKNISLSTTPKLNDFTVKPTDAYLFQFTPISGYLINTVTVKIGQYEVIKFTLKRDGIGGGFESKGSDNNSGAFSYYVSYKNATSTSKIAQIPYDGDYNKFSTNNIASLSSGTSGIYYKSRYEDGYAIPTENRFESFYLLVSGIYDNVEITVTTISFFEMAFYEDNDNNSLFNISTETKSNEIAKLGKLQIAYSDGGKWTKLSENDVSNDNSDANRKSIVVTNEGRLVYRVLFFGLAGKFRDGIAFHASGEDYSYSFSNGRYYVGLEKSDGVVYNPLSYIRTSGDDKNISLNNYKVSDGSSINDSTSYLYISTGKLGLFFNTNGDGIASKYKFDDEVYSNKYIHTYKYVITFKVSKQINSITSKSWLATDGIHDYQVDNPTTKTKTWFNDTTVTNIDFTNSLLKNADNTSNTTGDKTTQNWQNVSSNGKYIVDNNFGYGISFRYYVIPGYYLSAFSIKATSTGAKSLFSGKFNDYYNDQDGNGIILGTSSNDAIAYGILETALPREIGSTITHKQKISYKLTYGIDGDIIDENTQRVTHKGNGSYYEIQLFVNDAEGNDFETAIKNLGLLASDIEIDIYSIQYEIYVSYYANTWHSSSAEKTFSFNKSGEDSKNKITEKLVYDRESTISLNPSMVGYTFIGWGGDTIYLDEEFYGTERYNSDDKTWDSSSMWVDISNYFDARKRANLFELSEILDASDFYILNGKFMTDTGFSGNNDLYLKRNGVNQRPQEYNFWAAYADVFTRDINVERVDLDKAKFNIDLYAIWKANTYMVTFDMNDGKTRGTTTTYVSGYKDNVLGKFETISSSVILPSIGESGDYIRYSKDRLNAYITFDTDYWYVLVDTSTNDINFNKLPYSKSPYTNKDGSNVKEVSLSQYVIDRYGYTWLGWFSQKLDRVFESQSYYQEDSRHDSYPIVEDKKVSSNNAFVYGTKAYTTKIDEKNDGEFALLDYDCIVNLFKYNAQNTNSNVKEIEKSTRFLYKNLYKDKTLDDDERLETSLDYIYFYDYSGSTKGNSISFEYDENGNYISSNTIANFTYKFARDYLNDLKSDNYNALESREKDEFGIIKQVLMYYDTMLDYRYYNFSTKGTSGDSTKHNFFGYVSAESSRTYSSYRYLTLYAYWQTNSYEVNVDFRDSESENSTTGKKFGSTAVDKSAKSFMPVYFDDPKFSVQLSRFLPIRLGYDFIGWSFGPDSENNFTAATSYVFDDTWSQRLYSKDGLKIYPNNGFVENNREQLGDKNDETHVIYIFAVWRAQTYSINVSLNISASRLKNLYDIDSEFAIALYETIDNQGNIISFKDYLGINSNYLLNRSSADLSETAFGEIVANLIFEITFDQSIETAVLKNFNKEYTIKKLFATSAGYYLLGWMSGDIALVSNTTNSIFAEDGRVVSGTGNAISGDSTFVLRKVKGTFADGTYQYANDILYSNLDATLFEELVSSYYKPNYDFNSKKLTLNYTVNSSGDESGTALGSGNIDEYYTQNLNTLDYYKDGGRYQIYDEISGSKYYTTIKKSSNASSNFGYITENGLNYYIYAAKEGDKYVMYYIDASNESQEATKWYLYPYVQLVNSKNEMQYYAANKGSEVRFKFDGTNFYIDNYLVRFCNFNTNTKFGTDSMEPNAYYTSSTFDNAVAVKILFKKSKVLTENVSTNGTGISFGKDDKGNDIYSLDIEEYTLTKTREFTIYAQWAQKEDLNVTINNGNNSINGGQTADNNYGLAGYYRIKDSSENFESRTNSFEDQRATEGSNTNSSVSRNFEFYDKLDMFIAPYFNGRFLSEISFKFYSYEDVGLSSSSELYATRYQKIPYVLTLNFEWNSTNHMIELSKVTIKRSTKNENDVNDLSDEFGGDSYLGNTIKVNTNRLTQIGKRNDLAKLSLLNRDIMYDNGNSGTLLKVSDYIGQVIDYNKVNNFNELSSEDTGRIDINYILMNFVNVMTSMDITCKFSVQTYKLEIYNVFDTAGNNLESVTGTTNYRSTNYASLTDMLVNTKSVFGSSKPFTYEGSLATTVDRETMSEIQGGVIRVATISRDCAMNSKSYDVPYGTYIYGNYYNQQIRPVDEAYDPVKRTGYDMSDYTGYNYIFQEGYYNYGNSQTKIKPQESDGVIDTYGRQCYTILGSKTLFSNSVREPSALYTFVSWFMPTTASDGGDSLEFAPYSKDWEATAFRQNLCLVGYYYANNKPTSINFYTWNDNENAYEQYTNNITEYTLQSTETKYAFKEENLTTHELVRDKNITPYIDSTDEENRMILFFRTSFGVDATKFENEDAYSTKEIRPASKDFLRNNLIRNYWFYRHYSTMVYYNDNGTRRYICYDASDDSLTHYYYTTESGKKQYLQLFSDNLSEDNFIIYANKVDSEGDRIVISENYSFIEAQKRMFKLDSDKKYSYDFYGSKMYAMVNRNTDVPNDIEKYYPIKKIEDYLSDDSLSYETKQLISNMKTGDTYRARFYVQIKGETYFMAVAEAGESNISNLYTFAYNEETEKYSFTYKNDLILNATTPIANIDEYYLNVGTDYYKVNYYEYLDDAGSVYINPYVSRGSYETNICDFEYAGTTKRIYFNYNDKTFYETFNFEDSNNNKVTTKTLGVDDFKVYTPVNSNYSVNIGLKKEDAQKWSYLGVNINSLPSPNIGFWYNNNTYGYVGYIAFTDSDISYISSTTAENMFNYTTPEFGGTRHKNERIIDVLNDYIKALYEDTGAYSPEIIKLMKEKVTAYCNDYQPKGNIFKSLITVGEFYTTYKNGVLVDNIVEGVCLLIPITFELNIEYTDPQTHQTTIVNETITASVKYYINVVSDTTNIEGTIYAVPIYSRNVIEYTKKSVSVTNSTLNLNIDAMNKIYFETIQNMYTHFYNAKNGQYLKFAILSEEEYKLMINSNNYPDKLTYLLNDSRYSDINVFSEENALDGMLRIDLSGYGNGTYYVVAYYEKEGSNYAIRTSDNFIKLDIENSVIRYSLI